MSRRVGSYTRVRKRYEHNDHAVVVIPRRRRRIDRGMTTTRPSAWHVYVHKLRAWTAIADLTLDPTGARGAWTRPYLILIVDVDAGTFLSRARGDDERGNVFEREPTVTEVCEFVQDVIERPRALNSTLAGKTMEAGVIPRRVLVACRRTADALRGEREKWDAHDGCAYVGPLRELLRERVPEIESVTFAPVPEGLIERVIRERVEPRMEAAPRSAEEWGTRHLPGLKSGVDGFTDAFGKSLFGSAKAMFESEITARVEQRRPMKVSYRLHLRDDVAMRLTAFVSFDGSREEADFAFIVHKTLTQSQSAYEVSRGNTDVETGPQMGQTCAFASALETPFEDLDESELHDWPLVHYEGAIDNALYPLFFKVSVASDNDHVEIARPAIIELQAFEVAMRAIARACEDPSFTSNGDDVRASKGPWTFTVPTFAAKGEQESIDVEIEFPELEPMKPIDVESFL